MWVKVQLSKNCAVYTYSYERIGVALRERNCFSHMRIQPYGIGSVLHIVKRGARGMEIVRDEADRRRFMNALYILNEEFRSDNWEREISSIPIGARPAYWPERKPLTDVLGWTLLPNHLHLLLRVREEQEKGVTEFMQKLFRSMTGNFNEKYGERGSIFQGPYKSRTVDTDEYLRYVVPYVMVKNAFEMYPSGREKALEDFDEAWEWAAQYPYTSLSHYMRETVSHIIPTPNVIHELFPTQKDFRQASLDMLEAYMEKRDDLRYLQLED